MFQYILNRLKRQAAGSVTTFDSDNALSPFVEGIGLVFERWGFPRTAGRIWGWLHVCKPPHQNSDELAEALHVSKASISTNTRLLENVGLLERVGVRGSRLTHYRLAADTFQSILQQRLSGAKELRSLAERGLELLEAESPERGRRLERLRDFYGFVEDELERMLEEWRVLRKES